MAAVMPQNKVLIQKMPYNAVEIGCSSKMWPLLFPQHGPASSTSARSSAYWQQEIVTLPASSCAALSTPTAAGCSTA